jgi:hypothetical protein
LSCGPVVGASRDHPSFRRNRRTASVNPAVTWPFECLTLALMDDLERISVGVEYIGGIVSRIVF